MIRWLITRVLGFFLPSLLSSLFKDKEINETSEIEIQFKIQNNPDGLAQSFIIGADFIKDNPSCLILGDNLFLTFYISIASISRFSS